MHRHAIALVNEYLDQHLPEGDEYETELEAGVISRSPKTVNAARFDLMKCAINVALFSPEPGDRVGEYYQQTLKALESAAHAFYARIIAGQGEGRAHEEPAPVRMLDPNLN